MKTSICKGETCGKPIIWAETADGKRIPLDPKAPVYHVVNSDTGRIERLPSDLYMVSHFATCKDANKFSASNKDRK